MRKNEKCQRDIWGKPSEKEKDLNYIWVSVWNLPKPFRFDESHLWLTWGGNRRRNLKRFENFCWTDRIKPLCSFLFPCIIGGFWNDVINFVHIWLKSLEIYWLPHNFKIHQKLIFECTLCLRVQLFWRKQIVRKKINISAIEK